MAKRPTKPKADQIPAQAGPMFITVSEASASVAPRLYNPTDYEAVARGLQGTVMTACNFKATAFCSVPLRLMRRKRGTAKGKGWSTRAVKGKQRAFLAGDLAIRPSVKAMTYGADDDIEEVLDHPAIRLLQDPEPDSTGSQWWWLFHMLRQMTGRSFLWDGGEYQPSNLWLLRNPYVTIKYSRTNIIDGFWYGRDTTSKAYLPDNEVMYLRSRPSLASHVEACSWTSGVRGLAEIETAAVQSEIARWNNGGQPGMVFKTKGDAPVSRDKLMEGKRGLEEQVRGVNKHGEILILNAMEMVQYAAKPHEMNYDKGLELSEARIFRAAGIPEPMWKMAASNKASAVAADPQFASMTVLPELNIVADEMTESLLPRFGVAPGEMWFVFDNPVNDDRVVATTEAVSMYTAGLIRRGEARACVGGYDPIPDEENIYAQSPIAGMLGTAPAAKPDAVGDAEKEKPKVEADANTAAAVDESVQAAALNGAQIAALMSIATTVAEGMLPVEAARAIADAAFPLVSPENMDRIFNPLVGFKPKPEESNAQAKPKASADQDETATAGAGGDEGEGEEEEGDEVGETDNDVGAAKSAGGCTCTGHAARTKADDAQADKLRAALERIIREQVAGATITTDGTVTLPDVTDQQLLAIFEEQLSAIFEAGVQAVANDLDEGVTLTADDAVAYANERAAELVVGVTDTTREQLQTAVSNGLSEGRNIADIQADIVQAAPEISTVRAETIARTETARASQHGAQVQAAELGYDRKKWLLGGGSCPLCEGAALMVADGIPNTDPPTPWFTAGQTIVGTDGKAYTVGMDVIVPTELHPNCFPGDTMVSPGTVHAAMRGWYEGKTVTIRTEAGNRLTCTPNHMILTDRGWVTAGLLNHGDKVIKALVGDGAIDPNVNHSPSRIDEVFESLRLTGGVTVGAVPVAPEYLHGDAASVHGNIEVVATDRLLLGHGKPVAGKVSGHNILIGRDVVHAGLPGGGDLDSVLIRMRLVADGGVGGGGLLKTLLGSHAGHAEKHLVAAGAGRDSEADQCGRDEPSRRAGFLGDGVDAGLVDGVTADEIVSVEYGDFAGHVYDLTTAAGCYIANGIVAHNCRCDEIFSKGNDDATE